MYPLKQITSFVYTFSLSNEWYIMNISFSYATEGALITSHNKESEYFLLIWGPPKQAEWQLINV